MGQYIVLQELAVSRGAGLRKSGTRAAGGGMRKIALQARQLEPHEAASLRKESGVLSVAPPMPLKLHEPVVRGKPLSQKAAKSGKGGGGKRAAASVTWGVRAVGADKSPYRGSGIKVAVLDTGIDAKHPAFKGVTIEQKDFSGEGNGDKDGHGTHCAGTIFGRDVNGVRIGVAPGVDEVLIGKVLGEDGGSTLALVQGIQWALDNGANIISMSLGFDFPGYAKELVEDEDYPVDIATSKALEAYRANIDLFAALAKLARSRSALLQTTLIVAATGNESRLDENPEYEIAAAPPASAEGICSVAALGEAKGGLEVAYFSNSNGHIAAPGVDIESAEANGRGLTQMSGTSMATPHVAGVAALWAEQILKQHGRLSFDTLQASLIGSGQVKPLKAGFRSVRVGSGLVQAPR